MALEDKSIACRDCGVEFIFTAGEQGFYLEKGLLNEPQRCPGCRTTRRRERAVGNSREMTSVACAMCGGEAVVPFVPRLERPVYCSSCFEKVRAGVAS